MNPNQSNKFEADLRRVERILDRAKADLMNLLPEIESLSPAAARENGVEAAHATAIEAPAGESGKVADVHRWFDFILHKS